MMKTRCIALAGCCLLFGGLASAQKDRVVSIVHDNAQTDMTSKVYELKHTLANDIAPFVDGAVRRNNPNSRCDRINYSAGGKQLLIVSMDPLMVPYIDNLVTLLDYNAPKDDDGSTLRNAGLHNFVYRPIHRSTAAMYDVITSGIWGATFFRDSQTNVITWKGATTAKGIASWVKALDRPIPQVKLTMKIYTINESELKEVGFDYVAWKNGPGKSIFGFGIDLLHADVDSEVAGSNNPYTSDVSHSYTGFSFSPQIDLSYIRMLALKGKGKVKSAGSVVVKNDYSTEAFATTFADAKYKISYKPNYSSIVKDTSDDVSVTGASSTDYELFFVQPVVTFPSTTGKVEFTCAGGFAALFNLKISTEVGKAHGSTVGGAPIIDSQTFQSAFVMVCEQEKLLASFTKEQEIEQYNGIPILSELPGCRNIFGSTRTSLSRVHMFVTLTADPIVPDQQLTAEEAAIVTAAGQVKKINGSEEGK